MILNILDLVCLKSVDRCWNLFWFVKHPRFVSKIYLEKRT